MSTDVEAVVVGAGPGGAAAAFHLATRGRRVLLLERSHFPRDKSCGDGVTRSSVTLLDEMGLGEALGRFQPIRGVQFTMRNRGTRVFEYPADLPSPRGGVVVPRLVLDEMIVKRAVAAGAELWEDARAVGLLWREDMVGGVSVSRNGVTVDVRAEVVVAADGATSALGREAGLVDGSPDDLGVALRGYYSNVHGLDDLLEIEMPLFDVTQRYLLPSYGWIFPTGPDTANVGIGLFERSGGENIRELFERFMSALAERDPRFADAKLEGAWRGAPLRFDFSPERCMRKGLVLVGDAAGLISPFTGEGISFAIESGKLAAVAIDRALSHQSELDLRAYPRALGARFTGYFEAGRHSAQRYRLIWHVLDDTFTNERPAYAMARQAVLFPEGVGESFTRVMFDDLAPHVGLVGRRLRVDLAAAGQVMTEEIRADWPFLARMAALDDAGAELPLRPATMLLLGAYTAGAKPDTAAYLAAALELGHLGALAHESVEDQPGQRAGGAPNWGNMFAVLCGDYLLAKAYAMTARVDPGVSAVVADAVARGAEARVRELRHAWRTDVAIAEHVALLTEKLAGMFELPASIGAALGTLRASEVSSIAMCAREASLAHQLAHELLELVGRPTRLGAMAGSNIRDGTVTTPLIAALGDRRGDALIRAILTRRRVTDGDVSAIAAAVLAGPGVSRTLELARAHLRRSRSALRLSLDIERRRPLATLVDYVEAVVDRASALS